jgi:quercetin dioxygenase-like cupin family protein
MEHARIYELGEADWKPVRPDLTQGILGASLPGTGATIQSLTVTRVAPGGRFEVHRDTYRHVLYFFKGEGTVSVEGKEFGAKAGTAVDIPAGKSHSYANLGKEEMVLITANLGP